MATDVLLLTPPFTQLNTPYPATAYLKGYLNMLGKKSHQADLGIEVILRLFNRAGLEALFQRVEQLDRELDENLYRIFRMREWYLTTIDPAILFLQNKNPTLAHAICGRSYLPEAGRFMVVEDLEWAFGTMGIQDKARHLVTLYLEDLGDLIIATVDPHFGFSRYAERLGRTASSFSDLAQELRAPETFITELLSELLHEKMQQTTPKLVCLSAPFPGNLFGALKCAQLIRKHYPGVRVALGGGFANTELRSLSDPSVFDYLDFVCLDDGEAVLRALLEYVEGSRPAESLKRTFLKTEQAVSYRNGATETDVPQKDTGTPDYSDLPLDKYLSVIEIANPMHRLWSDGRWNKLTLAHGCYWGRCSFCDVSLDYIKRYEPLTAALVCDRIETIIAQTGQTGFHFVDEAAPPNLLREVALEIIRRKLTVTWWTNIRFEKLFTPDLSRLLKASGCIAVAGGLEVASDRLLTLMKKGVTVAQVAQVADGFTRAGIMVHAYLMYGFPTQTMQETVDSLEMVRQLFEHNVLQSGFWHRFAMTAHSPVGLKPESYQVVDAGPVFEGFADNDRYHDDPEGADHDVFAEGLRVSLYNYMHGTAFDLPLQRWFDVKIPKTTVAPDFIEKSLEEGLRIINKQKVRVVWLGLLPDIHYFEVTHQGKKMNMAELELITPKENVSLQLQERTAQWFEKIFPRLIIGRQEPLQFKELKEDYEAFTGVSFDQLECAAAWLKLREAGLLLL